MDSIMIGTLVKNSSRWLDKYFEAIRNLEYNKDSLRLVFIYGNSTDDTLEKIRKFKDEKIVRTEIYLEQSDDMLRKFGAQAAASIYKDFQELLDEDYFLLLDSDVSKVPADLITKLLSWNEDVVAPFVWTEGKNYFYDSWIFRINNIRFHPDFPPGLGLEVPFEVDAVGTCFLATREVFKNANISNPYPNLTFSLSAGNRGFRVLADPTTHIYHADVFAEGLVHDPLSSEMGLYPAPGFVNTLSEVKDVNGTLYKPFPTFSKNLQISNSEKLAYCLAMKNYTLNDSWRKKGKKWSYNYARFLMFWKTGNRELIKAMYDSEMYPLFIEVEPTTTCNLKCRMCEHTYWNEPAQNMSFEQFKYVIDQFPDLAWLGVTGIGESFCNKDFLLMLKYVKKKHDCFIEMYDSFFYMTPKKISDIIDVGVDRIIASVDAATKETYEKIRVGSNYDLVWKNIVALDRTKKKKGSGHYPELAFHYIITKENIHEVIPYLRKLKELDIDVEFVQFARMLHKFKDVEEMFIEVPQDTQKNILQEAERLGIKISWNADLPQKKPSKEYCTEIFMPFIFRGGSVITCCAMNEQNNREWQKSVALGNIFKQKFSEIWYSEKYRKVRQSIMQGKNFPLACRNCPVYEGSSS